MLKWTKILEVKECNCCPFFSSTDELYICNICKKEIPIFQKGIPENCPLKENNLLIKLEYKPKIKSIKK